MAYKLVSERYAQRSDEAFETVEDFEEMCRQVGFRVPKLIHNPLGQTPGTFYERGHNGNWVAVLEEMQGVGRTLVRRRR